MDWNLHFARFRGYSFLDRKRVSHWKMESLGAIHSTKISGNFGPKLNGSVRSNRKSFEKTGPPFEVVLFSRSDRLEFWLNGSRPLFLGHLREAIFSLAPRKCHIEAFVDTTRRSYVQFRNLFGELHGYLQLISSFEDTSQ